MKSCKRQYHPYGNVDLFKIPETADKVLNEYWDITKKLKIKTFLIYGVCLGFIRDGGYIEGDSDIDVGIFGDIEELTVELIKNGFERKEGWWKNRHFLKHGILIDVWFDGLDRKFLQSFDKVTYKKRDYAVPHPVKDYLKEIYDDWRTIRHRKVWP